MRCPFCNSDKVEIVGKDLLVVRDEKATAGRTSPDGLVYDEGIFHYECEKRHVFFGGNPKIVEDNAEQRRCGENL